MSKNPKILCTMLAKGHYSQPDINNNSHLATEVLAKGNTLKVLPLITEVCYGKCLQDPIVIAAEGSDMLTSKVAWSFRVFEALQNSTHSEMKSE